MTFKIKRLIYVAVGVTWCLVGAQVVIGGLSMIKTGGRR